MPLGENHDMVEYFGQIDPMGFSACPFGSRCTRFRWIVLRLSSLIEIS
jgi:hypothetical protein